ncbi:phage tail sheath C-terminal domain-containing protein [Anaerotignum propionicum]|uniref:phage tail sheath C-terminal domain-containing protein n=1 Tax=Anaerotignum propionicum TaxID=28446 RepID=UPI003AB977CF
MCITDKNGDFKSSQVIRVIDQIGNDIAVLFNIRYMGKVQNNELGIIAFLIVWLPTTSS